MSGKQSQTSSSTAQPDVAVAGSKKGKGGNKAAGKAGSKGGKKGKK